MAPSLWTWISVPLVGAVIGYVTNTIAVRMIFRPIHPVRVLGFRVQGLMGRRQQDLARSIGRVVGSHLVQHEDIVRGMNKLDLERVLGSLLDRGLGPKIAELRTLPLIGGFLTEDRIGSIRSSILRSVLERKQEIAEEFERALQSGLDVQALVTEKVAAFPVERLEALVLEVASRELRAIEILGGVLGALIGIGQVFLIWALE